MPTDPARRLRRLRFKLTLLSTLISAIGLFALAAFFLAASSRDRSQALDSDLRLKANRAVKSVWWDDSTKLFHSEGLVDNVEFSRGYPQIYLYRQFGERVLLVAKPRRPSFLAGPVRELAGRAIAGSGEILLRARIGETSIRLLATPAEDTRSNAAVVAVADEGPLRAAETDLRTKILLGTGGLLLLSALAGYLLAGRSTRPATEALGQQERFLADAAHEIRTPVAAIRALAEGSAAGDQPAAEALARTAQIAREAGETIDDLLLLARADVGRVPLQRESVRLDLLVEELCAEATAIELDAEPVVVDADPQLLRRGIANILQNAERHGRALDPHAAITVTVRAGQVTVRDGGPGIEPGVLATIFERFQSGRRSGGTGLGLPLARWVARAHGGDVVARTLPEGGAEFTLRIT